jgi:hypothetical protein
MLKRTYEEIKEDLLENGFHEKPFVGIFVKGFVFDRYVEKKNSHEYHVFPFIGGEFTGLRLDWEINAESLEDNIDKVELDDHLSRLFENALINDTLDIVGNVCRRMTNNDIDAPIIPAEAYGE